MKTKDYPTIKSMSPQFRVADMDRSLAFYTKCLGFEIIFRYEEFYAGIVKDGCTIHLKSGHPPAGEQEYKRRHEHLDITFSIEEIDAVYEGMKTKSVEIIQSLRDMPYGREFYIADPDSHIIGFLEEK